MRIAIVSLGSPFDVAAWSGTPYHMLLEIRRRHADVVVVDTPIVDRWLRRLTPLCRFGILVSREPLVCKALSRLVEGRLARLKPDVVIAINAEHKIAYMNDTCPLVLVSDGLFSSIVGYYPRYRRLSPRTRHHGDEQQSRVLDRVSQTMVSSAWAARSAAAYYGRLPSSFTVAPFGANLEETPRRGAARRTTGPLKLLFVGGDWARKGGALVLETFVVLRRELDDVELHIVGRGPRELGDLPGVTCHGRLRKSDPRSRQRLEDLYRRSSFLFVPSRQEAYGVVYCEACAFGLPSIGVDTGGVGSIIRSGVNGLLLPPDAEAGAFVRAIMATWKSERTYRSMEGAARAAFEATLNWGAWGDVLDRELRRWPCRPGQDAPRSTGYEYSPPTRPASATILTY